MGMQLVDDGALDTVIECTTCGTETRYAWRYTWDGKYDGDCNPIANGDCDCYGRFVDWALRDAAETHECPKTRARGV